MPPQAVGKQLKEGQGWQEKTPRLPVSSLTGKGSGLKRCSLSWPQSQLHQSLEWWFLPRMCFYFSRRGCLRSPSHRDVSWGCFSAEWEYPVKALPDAAPTLSQCWQWGRGQPWGYAVLEEGFRVARDSR